MQIGLKLASVFAVAALAGCSMLSALNPFASKPVVRNPPAALVDLKPTLAVHPAWSESVGKAGNFVFSPAFGGGSVFAAAANGTIVQIDAASGRSVWRIDAGMPLTAGVGTDGTTVAVAGDKGVVLAFDKDGKQLWKAQASSEVLSAPAVGAGLVIVRSMDNHIAAFDAVSGTRRWMTEHSVPSLTLRSAPGMTISGSAVFVALPGGRLLALALSNGGSRWEVAVGDPRGATELERITDTAGAPVVIGRDVCAVAYQGRLACFNVASGTVSWSKDLSSDVGLDMDERFVYAVDEHSAVSAFARDTGINIWRNDKLANRRLSAPVSYGRAVAVGDFEGFVHFLSREDGTLLARTSTDGSPIVSPPLVAGNHVIFQTQAGTVAAFGTE